MSIALPTNLIVAISNYSELLEAIHNYMDREDLLPKFDIYIRLVEGRINREIRSNDMEKIANLTLVSGAVPLPVDFLEVRRVSSGSTVLDYVSPMRLLDLRARGQSQVCHYAIVGTDLQTPPISADDAVDILYYARLDGLTIEKPENWLLRRHPDVYFFGCMFFATAEIEDETAAQWKSLFDEALNGLEIHNNSKRISGPMSPEHVVQVHGARA